MVPLDQFMAVQQQQQALRAAGAPQAAIDAVALQLNPVHRVQSVRKPMGTGMKVALAAGVGFLALKLFR